MTEVMALPRGDPTDSDIELIPEDWLHERFLMAACFSVQKATWALRLSHSKALCA